MNKKTIGIVIANIFLCCGLIAELNWWAPIEIPALKGYIDNHLIATNKQGHAIALFNDKIFGNYDAGSNQWRFVKLNTASEELTIESVESLTNLIEFSIEMASRVQRVSLNDSNQGFVIVRVNEGPHAGKVGCVSYSNGDWGSFTLLSNEQGAMPAIAQSSSGGAVAVWVNTAEDSDSKNCLMSATYNGVVWESHGAISHYKTGSMNYRQPTLFLGIDEMEDAIVVYQGYDKEDVKGEKPFVIATYFDGMQGKWGAEEVLVTQSPSKSGLHMALNERGDVFVVWESEQGIDGAFLNLSQYMLKTSYGIKNLTSAHWRIASIAQGDLDTPKVAVNERGNAVAVWLQGYAGMSSSCFNVGTKSWEGVSVVTSRASYGNAIQANVDGAYVIWIGEGEAFDEVISCAFFDLNSKEWKNYQNVNPQTDKGSLVDVVESFSLKGQTQGMLVWYDFFKEKLFYATIKEGKDPIYLPEDRQTKLKKKRAYYRQRKEEINKAKAERQKHR